MVDTGQDLSGKFDKSENTIIQVTDCETFVVVNGQTTSSKEINLNDLKYDFIDEFSDLFNSLEIKDINQFIDQFNQQLDELTAHHLKLKQSTQQEYLANLKDEINKINTELISYQTRQEQYLNFISNSSIRREDILSKIADYETQLANMVPELENALQNKESYDLAKAAYEQAKLLSKNNPSLTLSLAQLEKTNKNNEVRRGRWPTKLNRTKQNKQKQTNKAGSVEPKTHK
jgi:chromosome segregation protein